MPVGPRLGRVLQSDVAAAWILVLAVGVALVWANGPWAAHYDTVWLHPTRVGGRTFADLTTVRDWVNAALMAVFFLVVGLEIGRERRHGDLVDARSAVVPVAGALGGMVAAALVYAACNHGAPGERGWGIPMATDIAFAVGALALLRRWVPPGLRVFLLTLAVADDIGSVLVLGVFYSSGVSVLPLVGAVVLIAALAGVRHIGRLTTVGALGGGIVLWILLAAAGVEPALAGVVAGLLVPAGPVAGGREAAERLEGAVAPWSAFVVLPVFALANAGITFHSGMLAASGAAAVFGGVALARVIGKLGGITVACFLVVRAGWGRLPGALRWRHLAGGAALAGIGFTVPLLTAELAFVGRPQLVSAAELGLFVGSAVAFAVGGLILLWAHGHSADAEPAPPPGAPGDDGGPTIPW